GFFWFYFMNEHVLRFLGLRYPHDYNTVPRAAFWLLNLAWLFPWSAYFPAASKLSYKPVDRAGRTRLLALCCCFLPSPPRRSITPCFCIRRWLCCWAAR